MKHLLIFLLFSISSLLVTAQNQNQQLDSLLSKRHQEGAFNGNVLIAEKGKITFEKSYGLANTETRDPLTSASIFNLASLTKQFTATAVVILKNQGKLSIDDPLEKYIPELAFYKDITIRNLLTHTSGLPDYMSMMEQKWDKRKIANNRDVIDMMATEKTPLLFVANAKFSYSNTGYLLLATIIERVSKQSYAEFMERYIFKPSKMSHTGVVFRYSQKPSNIHVTKGYITDSLGQQVSPELNKDTRFAVYLDGVYGQGRVFSTARDLLKWDRMLYTEKLVSNTDKQLIFSSTKLSNGETSDYGFGWMIDDNKLYGKFVYHSGSWPGYATFIERHLYNDKTIIILQNSVTAKTTMSIKSIRKLIYGLPLENRIELSETILSTFAGTYQSASGKAINISLDGGKLTVPLIAKMKFELIPIGKRRFLVDGFSPDVTYEFIIGASGSVNGYVMEQKELGIREEVKKVVVD